MIRRARRDGRLLPRGGSPPTNPWTEPDGREDTDVSPSTTRYLDLCSKFEDARKRYRDYRSDCVFFASQFARQLTEYLGGPRDMVTFEPVGGARAGDGPVQPEEAIHLDEDTYYHLGLRLRLTFDQVIERDGKKVVEKPADDIPLHIRFKKIEKLYVVNLFGHEDFELAEPSSSALQPVFDELYTSVRRHYEDGLRLFLDKRGQNLHLPFTAARQAHIAGGA